MGLFRGSHGTSTNWDPILQGLQQKTPVFHGFHHRGPRTGSCFTGMTPMIPWPKGAKRRSKVQMLMERFGLHDRRNHHLGGVGKAMELAYLAKKVSEKESGWVSQSWKKWLIGYFVHKVKQNKKTDSNMVIFHGDAFIIELGETWVPNANGESIKGPPPPRCYPPQ